jgi:ferric-dicitrate binding protein FerR (iron transport regulator)
MTSGMDRLTEELRRWAERPAALSPRAARSRVLARLSRRPPRPAWRLAAAAGAAAALALALIVGALIVRHHGEPPAAPPVTAPAQRVIVHQLSTGTPLYIVVRPVVAGDSS